MTPRPSEVWSFISPVARKKTEFKHHLCVDPDGIFLFVSTHHEREEDHRGVMIIPNAAVPFLPPTATLKSEISCTTLIVRRFPDPTVPRRNPRGRVKKTLMAELLAHVKKSDQLTEEEREAILDSLYDYYGTDLG